MDDDPRLETFRLFARYNGLANRRLYGACAALKETERHQDRGAFFRSIHGTLNHILVGDRIWMARFEGDTAPSTGLDRILYDHFAELSEARAALDDRIAAFFDRLGPEELTGTIDYVNNEGRRFSDGRVMLYLHLFNHQTHHRGQVHAMLTQTVPDPPMLDLHRMLVPHPVAG